MLRLSAEVGIHLDVASKFLPIHLMMVREHGTIWMFANPFYLHQT